MGGPKKCEKKRGGSKKKEGGLPGEPKSDKKETLPYKGGPSPGDVTVPSGGKGVKNGTRVKT